MAGLAPLDDRDSKKVWHSSTRLVPVSWPSGVSRKRVSKAMAHRLVGAGLSCGFGGEAVLGDEAAGIDGWCGLAAGAADQLLLPLERSLDSEFPVSVQVTYVAEANFPDRGGLFGLE